jgi:enhancing lycopene biosynthesis protein 2
MTRVGVILSGCGFLDGSEIHEAVLTLLALDRAGATAVCFAPDMAQTGVVDHRTKQPAKEQRNVLAESARIARGKIADVATAKAADLDALVMPGGYGAAKNLCDFASAGAKAKVHPEVLRILKEMHAARKPIGAWCIAPAVLAAALGKEEPVLTIGKDPGTAKALESMGARHMECPVQQFCVDEEQRIVTSPAYMYDARIADVATGIERGVKAVLALAR